MAGRRSEIAMSDEEVRAYLAAFGQVTVATLMPDGSPHLVPMSFALVGGAPAFVTYAKSQKVRNVRRDPRMTVLATSGDRYAEYRGVQLAGTVEIVEGEQPVLELMQAIARRTRVSEPASAGLFPDELRAQAPKRIGLIFRSQRCVSWDHAKLGGRY